MSNQLRIDVFCKALGVWLQQAREKTGLTTDEAASAIGADAQHILAIETGKTNISGQDFYALLRTYKIPLQSANEFLETFGLRCEG